MRPPNQINDLLNHPLWFVRISKRIENRQRYDVVTIVEACVRRRTVVQAAAGSVLVTGARAGFAAERARWRIGLTAVILADQAAFLTRWADYLSAHLNARVAFVTRDQYQSLHDLLNNDQIDALWTCGYPFVRFQSRLQLLAVPLYRGQPTYQSYLIRARGDGTLLKWADLRDRVLAYSDPMSNSGWLVAQGQLREAGVSARDLRKSFFAHGHRNVAEAVAARLAHGGSIDGYVWETMRLQSMSAALETEVIWKSALHGFPPLVALATARPEKIEPLRQVLLGMQTDSVGVDLLRALNLDGFVAGTPSMFDSIRQLAARVPASGVES